MCICEEYSEDRREECYFYNCGEDDKENDNKNNEEEGEEKDDKNINRVEVK